MSIITRWASDERNAVCINVHGHCTWQDYADALAHFRDLCQIHGERLPLILHLHDDHRLPPDPFIHWMPLWEENRPYIEGLVFVGGCQLGRRFFKTFRRIAPQAQRRVFCVDTFDEALFITERQVIAAV